MYMHFDGLLAVNVVFVTELLWCVICWWCRRELKLMTG